MTSYRTKQASLTIGSITIAGFIVVQSLIAAADARQKGAKSTPYLRDVYHTSASPATFDQSRTTVLGQYEQADYQLEEAISNIYAKLLNSQKPLGLEFEEVLYKNLWNLYES